MAFSSICQLKKVIPGRHVCLLAVALCVQAAAQTADAPASLGVFEGQTDVGTVLHEGAGQYEAASKTYNLSGGGENMWFAADDFHYVWKKVSSADVTFAADIALPGAGGDNHRKGVLMIRQSLDADAPYADAAIHGDGLTSLQYRERKGAPTHEIESSVSAPKRLRLEKRGDRFYLWIGNDAQNMSFSGGSAKVVLTAPFYIGIGVCAHNKDAVQQASFSNVEFNSTTPVDAKAETYSTIQTITVASTDARAVYVSHDRLESPSWGNDPMFILFAADGKTQQVPVAGGTAQPSETELDESYGQDRSPDGRYIYMSSNRSGTAQIWRTSADGSNPEQLTHDDTNNSNPHLSPNGQQMVFVSYPSRLMILPDNTDITLKMMNLADKQVKILAHLVGARNTLGSHPWSPDGKRLTFVSYQIIMP